jgi:hypothetical protein
MGKKARSEPVKSPAEESAAPNDAPSSPSGGATPPGVEPQSMAGELPLVEAPMLGAGEANEETDVEAVDGSPDFYAAAAIKAPDAEATAEMPGNPVASVGVAPHARSFRFALLAAIIAVAAGGGSFLGSLTASGLFQARPAEATLPRSADARDVVQALKAELAELAALKANLDGVSRNVSTQFTKMTERLDRIEHAEADPATLARIAETVDRLAKRQAVPETTGSIASAAPAASSPAPTPGSAPAAAAGTDRVLDDWLVQGVRNGEAVVESLYGGVYVVSAGGTLPGLGRVEAVKRQGGHWIVVTARGLITSEQ